MILREMLLLTEWDLGGFPDAKKHPFRNVVAVRVKCFGMCPADVRILVDSTTNLDCKLWGEYPCDATLNMKLQQSPPLDSASALRLRPADNMTIPALILEG